ncbi:MAG: hypothetical protein R6T90_04510 [Dissulfuribacterales bacterium]
MKKWYTGFKLLAVILSFSLVLPGNVLTALAAPSTSTMKHKKLTDDYIPGFRIKLETEINDKTGFLVARCYFKTKNDKNFAFVAMDYIEDNVYQATLPAPWVNSEAIDYLFVVINKQKKVTRSEIFTIKEKETDEAATWKEYGEVKEIRLDIAQDAVEKYEILDEKYEALKEKYDALKERLNAKYRKQVPEYQPAEVIEDILVVKTELEKDLIELIGFYDNTMVVEVPAAMKYGLLAEGLYTPEQISAACGESSIAAATGAASAGTVTAAAGMSTGAIVLTGLGVAAGVAGGVVAADALSKDEEEGEEDPFPWTFLGTSNKLCRIRANWGNHGECSVTIPFGLRITLYSSGEVRATQNGGFRYDYYYGGSRDGDIVNCRPDSSLRWSFTGSHSNGRFRFDRYSGVYNRSGATVSGRLFSETENLGGGRTTTIYTRWNSFDLVRQ